MVSANDVLPNPFGEMGRPISESELRETAYEILIGACRSSTGSKPLTYISQSDKNKSGTVERTTSILSQPSLQRSLTSAAAAASKVKAALGMRREKGGAERKRAAATVGEMLRVQMRVSESTDSRVRRALLRIAAGQVGKLNY